MFAQAIALGAATDVLLPPVCAELLPEAESRFFERLSGRRITFCQDARGKVIGLTIEFRGKIFSFEKISGDPPSIPQPPKPRLAITLDHKSLDAIVGLYEFPPAGKSGSSLKLTVWRDGDRLLGQVSSDGVAHGAFDICPESKLSFFLPLDDSQLLFIANDKNEVTAVVHHSSRTGVPDVRGTKQHAN